MDGAKYRKHMRVMYPIGVEVKFEDSDWAPIIASDVSWGGVFLESKSPKAIGTALIVRMPYLDDGVKLELAGRVVRHNKVVDNKPVKGMGVEFDNIDDEAKYIIENLINKALKPEPE